MPEDIRKTPSNWLGLTPNLEHFDPFEGLKGSISEEELKNVRYGFRISGQSLLLHKTALCEFIQNAAIYPVPNTPDWLAGLINLRGNLIPVINLDDSLASNTKKRARKTGKYLLILDSNEDLIATFIDELPIPLQIEEESAHQIDNFNTAPDLLKAHIVTAYQVDETIWHEVDHKSLFRQLTTEIPVAGSASQH